MTHLFSKASITDWTPQGLLQGAIGMLVRGLVFVMLVGCNAERDAGDAARAEHASNMRGSGSNREAESRRGVRAIEHQFGILKPKERVEHRFAIHNDTETAWTISRIINTCSCTALAVSEPVVAPGSEQVVTVSYQAGAVTQDDTRRVVMLFEEPVAPRIALVVKAKIREPITCLPRELDFTDIGKGRVSEGNFELQNFSDDDWSGVALESAADWLTIAATPLDYEANDEPPRQVWRVRVSADGSAMPTGSHKTKIVVTTEGSEGLVKEVPVRGNVISPVVAIPEQFFFGTVGVGEEVERIVTLRFTPDAIPANPETVTLDHNLGEVFELEWEKTTGSIWRLRAVLGMKLPETLAAPKVSISFSDKSLPSLVLPVYAVVESE